MAVEHFNDLSDHYSRLSDSHTLLSQSQKLGRLYVERMQNLMLRPDIIHTMQTVSLSQYKFDHRKDSVLERMHRDSIVFGDILKEREAGLLKRVTERT